MPKDPKYRGCKELIGEIIKYCQENSDLCFESVKRTNDKQEHDFLTGRYTAYNEVTNYIVNQMVDAPYARFGTVESQKSKRG